MSYAPYGPRPTAGWRIVNSLWMLTGLLSLGILWFIGFWMVAIRRRTSALWYCAAVAVTVLDVGVIVLVALSNEDPDNATLDTLGSTFLGIIMLAVPVVAFCMNVFWLRWLWQDQLAQGRGAWAAVPAGYAPSPWTRAPGQMHDGAPGAWVPGPGQVPGQASGPGGYPGGAGAPAWGQPAGLGQFGQPGQAGGATPPAWGTPPHAGPQPHAQALGVQHGRDLQGQHRVLGGAHSARQETSAPVPAVPAAPGTGAVPVIGGPQLDLNLASVAQLAGLPGAGERIARAIVAERDARGAYTRVSDLVARGVVQPHVFLAFSTGLFAGPLAAPPTPGLAGRAAPSGRDGGDAGAGRRLEF